MRRLLGLRRAAAPVLPVLLPQGALRRGGAALPAAVAAWVEAMRTEGGWARSELDEAAVQIHAAWHYATQAGRGGHRVVLADGRTFALRDAAAAGLLTWTPGPIAETHATALGLIEQDSLPDAETLAGLDETFEQAGGAEAALAGLVAAVDALDLIEPVEDEDWERRVAEQAALNPERADRVRDLTIRRFARRLRHPVEAGAAIVLSRTLSRLQDFTAEPVGVMTFDDGTVTSEWQLRCADGTFSGAHRDDRLVVYRHGPEGALIPHGELDHVHADSAIRWAKTGHAALAAILGLEKIGAADRLVTMVFERQRTLKSGTVAAGFHVALDGVRDVALVVFPDTSAIVDPHSNDRLAEFDRETLAREAADHAGRLAALD